MVQETGVQSQVESKNGTWCLNTQNYKVRFKGKVEHSRESSSSYPLHLGVLAIEKWAFGRSWSRLANDLT